MLNLDIMWWVFRFDGPIGDTTRIFYLLHLVTLTKFCCVIDWFQHAHLKCHFPKHRVISSWTLLGTPVNDVMCNLTTCHCLTMIRNSFKHFYNGKVSIPISRDKALIDGSLSIPVLVLCSVPSVSTALSDSDTWNICITQPFLAATAAVFLKLEKPLIFGKT